MRWNIVYTAGAKRDLRDIYEYIAYGLLVPETASEQTWRIMYGGRDISKQLDESEIKPDNP